MSHEETIFEQALGISGQQAREEFLRQACAGDGAMLQRMGGLLRAYERSGKFLEHDGPAAERESVSPAKSFERTATLSVPLTEKPGDRIGRYKLLQKIGEGGCGVVYMAEQEEPVRRRVALKIIKPGMDTRQVVARFEAERQALALMDHPNIAKVHDAGATETGRPFFVMELVRGVKITEYCDHNNLPTRERLELFTQVCRAIQHAHQKGIIHRDIKPSNILVSLNDGVAVPKVIDFGIAKATQGRLTDATLFTAFEQFIGTPAYMSPEQAVMTSLDIDTRTDIYSLGVLLYELLTGKTPFDASELLKAGLDEMRRTIQEKEPARPSTRLSAMLENELTTTAKRRQTDAPKLLNAVRGDLDWIVMKCLEKDRSRRYETANGLASDVDRYLNQETVSACPPSNLYRFRKLVRRNKLAVAAVSAVAASLLAGLGASCWMYVKERAARSEQARLRLEAQGKEQRAQTEAAKSQQVAHFLKEMLAGVGPSAAKGRDGAMLREILDKTSQRLEQELTTQPEVEAELQQAIGRVYFDLSEFRKAREAYSRAVVLRRKLAGAASENFADLVESFGTALAWEGKLTEAEAPLTEALAVRLRLFGNQSTNVASSLVTVGELYTEQGKFAEAEGNHRRALLILTNTYPECLATATAYNNLAHAVWSQRRPSEAEAVQLQAHALMIKLFGPESTELANSFNNLGAMLADQGKLSEAAEMHRKALAMRQKLLGKDNPVVAQSLNALANLLVKQKKSDEAEPLYRQGLELHRKLGEHPRLGWSLCCLGDLLIEKREWEEAERLLREAVTLQEKLLPEEHPWVNWARQSLAVTLFRTGKNSEAEALLHKAVAGFESKRDTESQRLAGALESLAEVLETEGKLSEAEDAARRAWQLRKQLSSNDWRTSKAQIRLGAILLRENRLSQADELLVPAAAGVAEHAQEISSDSRLRLIDCFQEFVRLYESQGKSQHATDWKQRLAQLEASSTAENTPSTKK